MPSKKGLWIGVGSTGGIGLNGSMVLSPENRMNKDTIQDILDKCGFEPVETYKNIICKVCGSPYIERSTEFMPKDRVDHAGESFHDAVLKKRAVMESMGYYYERIGNDR
jgi:hypothetical protein